MRRKWIVTLTVLAVLTAALIAGFVLGQTNTANAQNPNFAALIGSLQNRLSSDANFLGYIIQMKYDIGSGFGTSLQLASNPAAGQVVVTDVGSDYMCVQARVGTIRACFPYDAIASVFYTP